MKKIKVIKGEEVLLEVSDEMLANVFMYGTGKGIFECINIIYDEMLSTELRIKLVSKMLSYQGNLTIKEEVEK